MKNDKSLVRVAMYSRYSSHLQRDESLEAQEYAMKKYIQEKGYFLVKRYADEAISGTTIKRPQFQQMLVDAQNKEFDILLVHKLDRLGRNILDMLETQRMLHSLGVKIDSVRENYDDSPEGEMFKHIQMAMNEYYSRNLGTEVMKGLLLNARECRYNGGHVLWGYKVNPETKKFEIEPKEAEVIRLIFEKFNDNWTYSEIADYLNIRGFKNKAGKPFSSKSSFYDVLVNVKYSGVYTYNRTERRDRYTKRNHRKSKPEEEIIRIPGGMPAIVSTEVFEKAQEILKKRVRTKGTLRAKETYLLSGLIVCDNCGASFHANTRVSGRNKDKYYSYRCSGRKNIGSKEKCRCREIKRDVIDSFVLNQVLDFILNDNNIDLVVNEINTQLDKRLSQQKIDIPQLKKRLAEVNSQLEKLVEALTLLENEGMEIIVEKMKYLNDQKSQITSELERMQDSLERVKVDRDKVKQLINEARQKVNSDNDKKIKNIIGLFVKRVIVSDEVIKIDFDFNHFFNLSNKEGCVLRREYVRVDRVKLVV